VGPLFWNLFFAMEIARSDIQTTEAARAMQKFYLFARSQECLYYLTQKKI
jgi:hypothetical protein